MSVVVPISSLTNEQIKDIDNILSFAEEDKEEEKQKWNKFAKKIPKKNKEIVKMYQVDIIQDKTYLRLPFRFACGFFGRMMNRDRVYPEVDFKFAIPLRPHQIPVVQEAYAQMYTYGTTQLSIPTGFGKSFMSVYLAGATRTVTAVVITIQALTDSWLTTFQTAFPDLKDRIWVVGEEKMPDNPAMIIFMYGRYEKIPEHIRKQIGCLIIDESHLHCTISRVPALLALEPKYVIGLSATPERDDGMERMIYSITGTHMVERLSENDYKIIKLKTDIKIPEERTMYGVNYAKLVNDQAEIMERNIIPVNIVNSFPTRKFMILTKTKEHVEALEKLFEYYKIPCDSLYGSKKKYTETRVLIGTISKISTGFDESTKVDNFSGVKIDTLILMTTLKKPTVLKQAFGRVVGRAENPRIVYLVDNNAVCKRHFNECKDLAERTKGEIVEFDYDSTIAGGGIVL